MKKIIFALSIFTTLFVAISCTIAPTSDEIVSRKQENALKQAVDK